MYRLCVLCEKLRVVPRGLVPPSRRAITKTNNSIFMSIAYAFEALVYLAVGASLPILLLWLRRQFKERTPLAGKEQPVHAFKDAGGDADSLLGSEGEVAASYDEETHVHFVVGDEQTSTEVMLSDVADFAALTARLAVVGTEATRAQPSLQPEHLKIEYGIPSGDENVHASSWMLRPAASQADLLLRAFGTAAGCGDLAQRNVSNAGAIAARRALWAAGDLCTAAAASTAAFDTALSARQPIVSSPVATRARLHSDGLGSSLWRDAQRPSCRCPVMTMRTGVRKPANTPFGSPRSTYQLQEVIVGNSMDDERASAKCARRAHPKSKFGGAQRRPPRRQRAASSDGRRAAQDRTAEAQSTAVTAEHYHCNSSLRNF